MNFSTGGRVFIYFLNNEDQRHMFLFTTTKTEALVTFVLQTLDMHVKFVNQFVLNWLSVAPVMKWLSPDRTYSSQHPQTTPSISFYIFTALRLIYQLFMSFALYFTLLWFPASLQSLIYYQNAGWMPLQCAFVFAERSTRQSLDVLLHAWALGKLVLNLRCREPASFVLLISRMFCVF